MVVKTSLPANQGRELIRSKTASDFALKHAIDSGMFQPALERPVRLYALDANDEPITQLDQVASICGEFRILSRLQ